MIYRLMRVIVTRRGYIFAEITFDLWNHEYNVGYEITVSLYKDNAQMDDIIKYCRNLVGFTYDISKWDKIIRDIKQNKIEWSDNK